MKKVDRDFRRFQEHGDGRALGRVFDRLAPVLWRIAAEISRDRHEAEDLVQSCFLKGIEKAGSWDPTRPVLPWLLGILTLLAREARRQSRRAPEHERLATSPPPGPSEQAAARELETALDTAISRVPETYREVLAQHLRNGRSAPEIASVLGLRPGAVRMRIHRGLLHLRAHLPRGLTSAGIAVALGGAARAQMRARVLARVPATTLKTAAGATLPLLGALTMKTTFAVILAASSGLLLWQLLPVREGAPDEDAHEPRIAASAKEAHGSELVTPGAADETGTRRQRKGPVAPAANGQDEGAKPVQFELELRVVDSGGHPVPGARVIGRHSSSRNLDWQELGRTDPQGVWRHASVHSGLHCAAERDGRVRSRSLHVSAKDGPRISRRLELRGESASISGTVLARDGSPCSHARVLVQLEEHVGAHGRPELLYLRADARGQFASRCVPAGACELFACDDGSAPRRRFGRLRLRIPHSGTEGIVLRLQDGASVSGVVRGLQDSVRTRHHVMAGLTERRLAIVLQAENARSGRTDETGAFTIEGLLPGRYTLESWVGDDVQSRVLEVADGRHYEWNPEHGASLGLRFLVLGPKEDPLQGWTLRAERLAGGHSQQAEVGVDGRCAIDGVADDEYGVLLFRDPESFPALAVTLRPSAEERLLRVAGPQMANATLTGRIVPNGVGLEELRGSIQREIRPGEDPAFGLAARREVTVDRTSGRFELGSVPAGNYVVVVLKGRAPAGFSSQGTVTPGGKLDFGDIAAGAAPELRIRARNEKGELLREFDVQARPTGRKPWNPLRGSLDADGRLRCPVPPLPLELLVSSPVTAPVFCTVNPTPGATTPVEVSCRSATPCVFVWRTKSESGSALLRVRDRSGRVVVEWRLSPRGSNARLHRGLPPGRYEWELRGEAAAELQRSRAFSVPTRSQLHEVEVHFDS